MSKRLKVSIAKTKVKVSGGIKKNGLSKSKVDLCGVCNLRVKAYSALCVQCGKWIHRRCAGVNGMTAKLSMNFSCRKCEWNIWGSVEREETLCNEVETLRELTYLGDRVNAGG